VFDYTPKEFYPSFRVNKAIAKLIDKRITGLTLSKSDITENIFFGLL
jgi:hypothetical protein